MIISKRLQAIILLIGDLFLFYAALLLTLIIRHNLVVSAQDINRSLAQIWDIHKWPFFFVHIIWVFLFYISNLYDVKKFPAPKTVMAKVLQTMFIAGMLAALIFYLIPSNPSFRITPKTNLLIDVILVTLAVMVWRRYFWLWISKASKIKVLFFGKSEEVENLANHLKENTQLGYEPIVILEKVDHNLADIIRQYKIQLIVASRNIMEDKNASQKFYEALSLGISTVDFATFYETTMEKIPVSSVNESWFLVNLVEINKQLFELAKRIFDVILTVILGILTLLIFPLIAFLIKVGSRGPIFYRQKRVGKNGKIFEIIKFRSMVQNAEENGAKWADEKDKRMTKIGKILRKTRIDELPQLWNILKGEMSFIGPRPERPEFVNELQKQIPHYAMRHLIKPGLSGWAQIKFPYGASVQDTTEKLQYDLYYVKNRSMILDLAIALRTIATMVGHTGR